MRGKLAKKLRRMAAKMGGPTTYDTRNFSSIRTLPNGKEVRVKKSSVTLDRSSARHHYQNLKKLLAYPTRRPNRVRSL